MAIEKLRYRWLRVGFESATESSILEAISEAARASNRLSPLVIASGNARALLFAQRCDSFNEFLSKADLVRIDGFGVRAALWIAAQPTPQRSTWADFGWRLAEHCSTNGLTVFMLGGKSGVAERAAFALQSKYPDLDVVGAVDGFGRLESAPLSIAKTNPDVLIVALGMPRQEKWITDHMADLAGVVGSVLTAGGALDYLSGDTPRPPIFLTATGFEWLGRILIDPTRLARRYASEIPVFVFFSLVNAIKARIGS